MASGGGNRPANLSFSLPPTFSSSTSLSSSLQTPDTNSFFLSTVDNSDSRKDAPGSMLGNASPSSAGPQSFSSLEELLNVTGINSSDLGGLGSGGGGGVDSLQQLAKEVESKQLGELHPPAAKRPHLELRTPPPPTQPHPLTTHQQLPSNIRVQPLNFPALSQLPPPAVTIASLLVKKAPPSTDRPTLPPARSLPSPQLTSTTPTIPSLFSSVYQPPSYLSQIQQPTSIHQSSESNSLMTMSTNLTAPPVMANSGPTGVSTSSSLSSSFSFTTISNASLSQPSFHTPPISTTTFSTTSLKAPPPPPLGFHPQQLPPPTSTSAAPIGNISNFPHLPPTQPPGHTPLPSATSLSSTAVAQSFVSQAPMTSLMMQTGGGQQLSLGLGNIAAPSPMVNTTASGSQPTTAAISPVFAGPNPLVQLVQLYKQFHSQGDQQGMLKIKQQLNILIARQKIIAAQNSLRAVQSGLGVQPSMGNLSTASVNTAPTVAQTVNARLGQSQTASSSMALGQMPQVLQSGQLIQQTGGNLPLPPNFTTGPLPSRPTEPKPQSLPSTVPQVPPFMLPPSQAVSSIAALGPLSQTNASMGMTSAVPLPTSVSQLPPFSLPPPPLPAATAAKVPSTTTALPPPSQLQQTNRAQEMVASQSLQQQIVKRLQTVIASLPESQRPKTIPDLRDFVQKYSSLIAQNSLLDLSVPGGAPIPSSLPSATTNSLIPPRAGPSSSITVTSTRPSHSSGSIPSLLNSSMPLINAGATKLSHSPSTSSSTAAPLISALGPAQINNVVSQSPSAQVAEHFKSSLAALSTSKVATVGGAVAAVPSVMPSSMGMGLPRFAPGSVSVASTVHAPVTTQFTHKVGAVNSLLPAAQTNKPQSAITPSQAPPITPPIAPHTITTTTTAVAAPTTIAGTQQNASGIQAGVATPLPPGLTLETLGVLCRLPESDLLKLKLPAPLLSAIKVWKARQPPSRSVTKTSAATNKNSNNIPVLTAAGPLTTSSANSRTTAAHSQTQPSTAGAVGMSPFNVKVGNLASSKNFTQTGHANKVPTSTQGMQLQQPMVIPSNAGFPPRSLHAFIPGLPQTSLPQKSNSTTPSAHKHQTRYKAKAEQQKAETERMQALAKVLQSSEEARIAFRFSSHLDKMHTQLLSPDAVTPFRSHHDILARLLPYHVYAEPEPPPAAVEKADAVFESVAQVLLSRSRGLTSRFEQIVSKSDAEGGPEQLAMKMQLERLFIEGEQERIRQENIEKQQAEQVAADLSLMADGVDAFEPDFSLGDAFCPLLDMSDTGIT